MLTFLPEPVRAALPRLMRLHRPSGSITEGTWSGAHHWMLGDPEAYPHAGLRRVCDELVARWNRQQPATWHYWLE